MIRLQTCYALRGENDPKGDTEMSRSAGATVDPESRSLGSSISLHGFSGPSTTLPLMGPQGRESNQKSFLSLQPTFGMGM